MIYQLNDSDCESVGLIQTTETEEKIEMLWSNWYMKTDDEISTDNFCDYLREKDIIAEPIYLTEINC